MSPGSNRGISSEVVRVAGIERLSGPLAHAIGSLGFLVLATGLWATGWDDMAFAPILVAWLVSLNGLSLYGWEWLLDAVESRSQGSAHDVPDRTLSVPSLSVEHRAELVAGSVQTVSLVAFVGITIGIVRWLGVETGAYVLVGLIATGNLVALVAVRRR